MEMKEEQQSQDDKCLRLSSRLVLLSLIGVYQTDLVFCYKKFSLYNDVP